MVHILIKNEIIRIDGYFSSISTLRSFNAKILAGTATFSKVVYNGVSSDITVSLAVPATWPFIFDGVIASGVKARLSEFNDTNAASCFF